MSGTDSEDGPPRTEDGLIDYEALSSHGRLNGVWVPDGPASGTGGNNINDVPFHCHLCPEVLTGITEADDHLRLMHPEEYGDGPERWPDGGVVLEDQTLDPGDFRP